jgi:SSS family solute:Na+ symporter
MRFLLPYFLGICAFVFAVQHPALRTILLPDNGDADSQITLLAMPVFLSQILPAGLIGIISAGMLAAFMSTHDSYLLCWSSVLTQDVVAPWFRRGLSSKKRLLLTRVFIVAIGIFILVWGLWYPLGQDLWDYMAISGAIYFAGAISLLIFGLYWKRASKVGAYGALVCGFLAVVGLTPVQNLLNPLKLRFGFTEEIAVEKVTEKMVLVAQDIPIEEITAETVEVYKTIGSEIVGLAVITLATLAMILGSLLFPQSNASSESKE